MEKRVIGFILTILGVGGLITAGVYFMQGGTGNIAIKSIIMFGILGFLFFFAGVALVKGTKDKAT